MKRSILYPIIAALLAGCTADAPDAPSGGKADQYEMHFLPVMCGLSRSTGIYQDTIYPVKKLYLTAFITDSVNTRQYYFIDKQLNYDQSESVWKANDWYWPLQGNMSFLSYWCPGFSREPSFDQITDAEGNNMPRMTVDATDLDGKTDFIYLSQTHVKCPQVEAARLLYSHGLTWITISLKAEVIDEGTGINTAKTNELISRLKVHKVVIEDCARKGIATVVPGNGINWKTYDDRGSDIVSFTSDQVYYINNASAVTVSDHNWVEHPDASQLNITSSLPITSTAQPLGVYPVTDDTYIGQGLLIVPQNKTAITVDYTVTDIKDYDIHKVERFELRDNTIAWLPGYHYNYEIVFRNYSDIGNFEVIPDWAGVYVNESNYCYDSNTFGLLKSGNNPLGNTIFVIEPMHDGGSGTGDDMDYPEGPRVF